MKSDPSPSLDPQSAAFVEAEVAAGRYETAGDVVRAALRLLREREARLGLLRAALQEGEASGAPAAFDFDAFLDRKNAGRG